MLDLRDMHTYTMYQHCTLYGLKGTGKVTICRQTSGRIDGWTDYLCMDQKIQEKFHYADGLAEG